MGADSAIGARRCQCNGRRLRRKFILVAMGAVTVVLTLIIVGINIVNYSLSARWLTLAWTISWRARTVSIGRMGPRPTPARMWAPVRPLPVTGWPCAPGTSKA
ncbi:MAG: hypothetical protein ACLU37_10390 [Collinsella sp.]